MDPQAQEKIETGLAMLRVLLGALNGGVLVFTFVALFLVRGGEAGSDAGVSAAGVLVRIGFVAVVVAAAYFVFRASFLARLRREWAGREPDADAAAGLIGRFTTLRVTAAMLAAGVAFVGLAVFLATGRAVLLAAPLVVIFLLMVFRPSLETFREFATEVTGRPW